MPPRTAHPRRIRSAAVLAGSIVLLAVAAPGAAAVTVTIDSGPPNPTADTSATFTFHSTLAEGSVSYACTLDSGDPASCTSPKTYAGLAVGDHLFTVRVTDARSSSTDQYRWTVVDTRAPETTIDDGPPDPSSTGDATFRFSADEAGSTFACSLDGAAPAGCSSPLSYLGLAPGRHTFSVAATDPSGNTDSSPATRSWTVSSPPPSSSGGASGSPQPSGAASTSPITVAPHPVSARSMALRLHGPFTYTGKRFARMLARNRGSSAHDAEEIDTPAPPVPEPAANPCPACTNPFPPEGLGALSAVGGTPWDAAALQPLDLQVAASTKSFLLLADGADVAFYDKAGKLLKTDKQGKALPYANPIAADSFFAPLLKIANTKQALNVPANTDGTLKYKLDTVYDTRLLWDSYRNRFWVVSQAVTSGARGGVAGVKPADLPFRRDKIFAALSRTADPRDGFIYWYWDAEAGDGSCTPATQPAACVGPYLPGDGGDYFSIGVSKHAITEVEYVGDNGKPNHNWDEVNVFRADKMAAGTCTKPDCGWAYWDIQPVDGSPGPVVNTLTPAQQHGSSPGDAQYLAGTVGGNGLAIYRFEPGGAFIPPLVGSEVAAAPFRYARNGRQPPAPNGENNFPQPVNLGANLPGTKLIRAVYRAGRLYALKPDCGDWAPPDCTAAIHLWRVDPETPSVSIDRIFGKSGPGDSPDAIVGYGWPMMDVNKDGTMAIGFQRSGAGVFPEARYSLRFANDGDMRPSHVLRAGSYPLGEAIAALTVPVGRLDVTGAAVDPFDDRGVWLIQAYAHRLKKGVGGYQPVVERVLGSAYADVAVSLTSQPKQRALAPGKKLSLGGGVANLGDGAARSVRVRALLMPAHGRPTLLGSTSLGDLQPGGVASFHVDAEIPAHGPAGHRVLRVVATTTSAPQYDTGNDAVAVGGVIYG